MSWWKQAKERWAKLSPAGKAGVAFAALVLLVLVSRFFS